MNPIRVAVRGIVSFADARRQSSGDAQFALGVAFGNLLLAALVVAADFSFSFCGIDRGLSGFPVHLPGVARIAGVVLLALALVLSVAQLVPGSPRWRLLRGRIGVANLVVLWPAVAAFGLAAYLSLDASFRSCLV